MLSCVKRSVFVPRQSPSDDETTHDVYLSVWLGETIVSGVDYLSEKLLLGRWK